MSPFRRPSRPIQDARQATRYLLGLLQRRGYSVAEAADRLDRRKTPPAVQHEVLLKLERQGFLHDETYAASFAQSRASKGWGPHKVRAGLLRKKIAGPVVQKTLREAYPAGSEEEMARQLLERKRTMSGRRKKGEDPGKSTAKVLRFLLQRGYSLEAARRAVRGFLGYNPGSFVDDDE